MSATVSRLAYINSTSIVGRERVFRVYVLPKTKEIFEIYKITNSRFICSRYEFISDTFYPYKPVNYETINKQHRNDIDKMLLHKSESNYLIILILIVDSRGELGTSVYEFSIENAEKGLVPKEVIFDETPVLRVFSDNNLYQHFITMDMKVVNEALSTGKLVVVNINYNKRQTNIIITTIENYIRKLNFYITHPNLINKIKMLLENNHNVLVIQTIFFLQIFPVVLEYQKIDDTYIYAVL